jgi:hypothetical protein
LGIPGRIKKEARSILRGFRDALEKDNRGWAKLLLEEITKRAEDEPKLDRFVRYMEEEYYGEVRPGESSEEPRERRERKGMARPEDVWEHSEEVDQTRTEDDEEVLEDARTEKMKFVEGRYFMWVEKERRSIEEIEDHYLRYLGTSIGARQPVPGEGIAGREWEEIARINGEIDATIRRIEKTEKDKRTEEDNRTLERAIALKRFGSAYYHELEYYHRFWYGDVEGIGKSTYRPKEGSRLMLIDQWVALFSHPIYGPKIEKAFKEETGYKSDAELIDEVNDPYGFRRLGHHLRRYACTPMYRDAYLEGIRIGKPGEPGFGHSYEYSLYAIFFTKDWTKVNNPKAAAVLAVRDPDGRLLIDLGDMGGTFDMFTTPDRWRLYLLFWKYLGKRNKIRLSARRDFLEANRETFLSKEESDILRETLRKDRDGESLSEEERDLLVINYSDQEIRELQELLVKERIRGERLEDEEEKRLIKFRSVIIRNMINRDLGFDPSEEDFDMTGIFSDPLSRHDRITANDILTNILVDVRRMEQTKDDLAAGKESFISQSSLEKALDMENDRYAHLGSFPWLKEIQIDILRDIASRLVLAGVITRISYSGGAVFEEERKKTFDGLKTEVSMGLHAGGLKDTYCFDFEGKKQRLDFTDKVLRSDGASLDQILDLLLLVHGEGNLRRIYEGDRWFLDVLENRLKAGAINKRRFLERFGFNDYHTFEANVIEEPVLNTVGVTRKTVAKEMTDRERTFFLWLAKKGQLPGNKGIFMKSRDQEFRVGWEGYAQQVGEKEDRRREGGRWIYGYQPEKQEWEKVGYVENEVFYRTIAWEDPVQRSLFSIEDMMYSRNADLISKYLDEHSPEQIDNPNEWLTPPMMRDMINHHLRNIDIDTDRANELLMRYGADRNSNWRWTAKRWTFGYLLENLMGNVPGIGRIVGRVPASVVGFTTGMVSATGAAGGLIANPTIPLVGRALATYPVIGPFAGNAVAAGFIGMGAHILTTVVSSVLFRRAVRLRTFPGTNWRIGGLLPFWWAPKGAEVEHKLE